MRSRLGRDCRTPPQPRPRPIDRSGEFAVTGPRWHWASSAWRRPWMADVRIGIFVFALLAGAALLALWLHPRLPSHHLSKETTDIVRLGVGVVATITALALGLLISSVKGSFDQVNRDVQVFATRLILTDRALRLYGPGAEDARVLLRRYTERALYETWPKDKG